MTAGGQSGARPGVVSPRLARRSALAVIGGAAGLGTLGALVAGDAFATLSPAAPPEVAAAVPGARLRGSGRLTFLGLHVYDARLWVSDGFNPAAWEAAAIGLELVYARRLVGRQIAERSLKEMQRVPGIAPSQGDAWLAEMREAFPDVDKDDRITGVLVPGAAARFYKNGQRRREVRDSEFARRFFGIWLGPQTSQPQLREALLGLRT